MQKKKKTLPQFSDNCPRCCCCPCPCPCPWSPPESCLYSAVRWKRWDMSQRFQSILNASAASPTYLNRVAGRIYHVMPCHFTHNISTSTSLHELIQKVVHVNVSQNTTYGYTLPSTTRRQNRNSLTFPPFSVFHALIFPTHTHRFQNRRQTFQVQVKLYQIRYDF